MDSPSRFLIGIDLGTTNSAVAYVDTTSRTWEVRDLELPQLVAAGTVEGRQTLPSFHYEAAAGEFAPGALRLPWSADDPKIAVGAFARDHGAAVPGRLVVSAKSWLSHSGVDRTAGLLPWHGAADTERLSPVQVSARYLAHMRAAWDARFPEHPMAGQDVVLAVPASFDEVARELTVEAARQAGLVRVVLVEEPQAAFYAWIDAQGAQWDRHVKPGQKILVADVGGGTSDFTLIRVRPAGGAGSGKVLFHRVAVGEHLILGGDNLDLAIAHYVEKKLGRKLEPRQWGPLVRSSRVVKETLLGSDPPERAVINIAGGGAKLIGGSTQISVTREEIQDLLVEGFLPRVALDAKPTARRSGFQEFGLPYAPDAAITRYLAAFLSAHRNAGARDDEESTHDHDPARPDLVLFNGGLFESPVLRERLLEVMASWFNEAPNPVTFHVSRFTPPHVSRFTPEVLKNDRLDLAVARGAAYYGMVRRGHGVRISGGLAHSYFLGVETGDSDGRAAICLLPAGVEEGQVVELPDRIFNLRIRQPVEFPLYASSTRTTDRPGDLIPVDPEQMTALPPIRTVLQSGRKATAEAVQVRLHAKLTEIGTLDIWCAEAKGDRQWRLQFDVRAATRADVAGHEAVGEAQGVVDEQLLVACQDRIRAAFRKDPGDATERPESLVKTLEQVTETGRLDWPSTLLRGMWETLWEVSDGRRLSEVHEARWLNLAGFCLRPGYGLAADDWRVGQMWKLLPVGVVHPKNELVRAEWWILWRRLAGGLTAGQQRTLAEPLIADWRTWLRKSGSNVFGRTRTFQFGPHESAEVWRMLGSLELLPTDMKLEIGAMLLERLPREQTANVRDAVLFALGRIGARVPVYGPLNSLVPPEAAEEWATRMMGTDIPGDKAAFAAVQLCRKTGDRYRDVSEAVRDEALQFLTRRAAPEHYLELVKEGGQLATEEQKIVFGESLPRGLRIE
ncbi:MAG: Chaperone protein DnaK [Phycisphaerales bacterium]|nr:Chaperone protein DnaK [Phycisphaerales bacterium]